MAEVEKFPDPPPRLRTEDRVLKSFYLNSVPAKSHLFLPHFSVVCPVPLIPRATTLPELSERWGQKNPEHRIPNRSAYRPFAPFGRRRRLGATPLRQRTTDLGFLREARCAVKRSAAAMSDVTPHGVFLSAASQDAVAARRICEALRAAGSEVWFDQRELRGGEAWDQQIRRQINPVSSE